MWRYFCTSIFCIVNWQICVIRVTYLSMYIVTKWHSKISAQVVQKLHFTRVLYISSMCLNWCSERLYSKLGSDIAYCYKVMLQAKSSFSTVKAASLCSGLIMCSEALGVAILGSAIKSWTVIKLVWLDTDVLQIYEMKIFLNVE